MEKRNTIIRFKKHLDSNVLPGTMIAMLEERTFLVEYENEFLIVYDPLDGFYGLHENYYTLEDYIKVNKVSNIHCCEVYDNDRLSQCIKSIKRKLREA